MEGLDNWPEQKVWLNDFLGIKLSWTTLKCAIKTTLNRGANKDSLKKHKIHT